MAKVRVQNDAELLEDLRKKFELCDENMRKLSIEFNLANEIYQGVQASSREGALDVNLLFQMFTKRPTDDEIRLDTTVLIHACLFLHSKLSISDPQIVMRPYNSDVKNYKAAQVAQLVVEHIKEETNLAELLQRGPYLNTAIKGNGILAIEWDPDGGELEANGIDDNFNPLENEIRMTGDFKLRDVRPDCFFIDPAATILEKDAEHCFEIEFKQFNALAANSAISPEVLAKIKEEMNSVTSLSYVQRFVNSKINATNNTIVPLFHYWEPHRAWNGMLGAHVIFMNPIKPLLILRENNYYHHGRLPFIMLTDIDIPNSPYGMSRILYALPLQEAISQMFTQTIANIELHGNIRLLMPEGGLNDEARSNNPYDVLFFNPATGEKPIQMTPTHITTDIWRFDTLLRDEVAKLYGMSQFSQGEIPRELSSYAVQMAIEMDDKFRVRLFNKKKEFIRNSYEMLLSLSKQYIKTKRMLKIVGETKIHDLLFFDATDLEGDYGVSSDYGMYLPVDPAARKQQIIELVKSNVLKDAGIDTKKIISVLISGDVLQLKDLAEKSKQIQDMENIELLSSIKVPVAPWHEHEGHIESITDFMQEMFFEKLPLEIKTAFNDHKQKHIEEFAKLQAAAQGGNAGGEESPINPGALTGAPTSPGGAPPNPLAGMLQPGPQ